MFYLSLKVYITVRSVWLTKYEMLGTFVLDRKQMPLGLLAIGRIILMKNLYKGGK